MEGTVSVVPVKSQCFLVFNTTHGRGYKDYSSDMCGIARKNMINFCIDREWKIAYPIRTKILICYHHKTRSAATLLVDANFGSIHKSRYSEQSTVVSIPESCIGRFAMCDLPPRFDVHALHTTNTVWASVKFSRDNAMGSGSRHDGANWLSTNKWIVPCTVYTYFIRWVCVYFSCATLILTLYFDLFDVLWLYRHRRNDVCVHFSTTHYTYLHFTTLHDVMLHCCNHKWATDRAVLGENSHLFPATKTKF